MQANHLYASFARTNKKLLATYSLTTFYGFIGSPGRTNVEPDFATDLKRLHEIYIVIKKL